MTKYYHCPKCGAKLKVDIKFLKRKKNCMCGYIPTDEVIMAHKI